MYKADLPIQETEKLTVSKESIPALRLRLKVAAQQSEQDQIREFNSIPSYLGEPAAQPEPDRFPVRMDITNDQWKLVEEALGLLQKQSEGYIKRAQNNPSETIKSPQTIKRHQAKLASLFDVISRFNENAY